jgi:hypothetical protein
MLQYTDITQNAYFQSGTVTEIIRQGKVWLSLGFHVLYVFGLAAHPTLRMSVLERAELAVVRMFTSRMSVCTAVLTTAVTVITC